MPPWPPPNTDLEVAALHTPASPTVRSSRALLGALALLAPLLACQPAGNTKESEASAAARDIHSLSRPDRVRTTHAVLDWTVDFNAEQIRGGVTWTFERAPGASEDPLILDTRGLTIEAVKSESGQPLEWTLAQPDPVLGRALSIQAVPGETKVVITYRTGPDSDALQWLKPAQTAGKEKPFLFSQAQAILARTMLPCQDSPGVRITYEAAVKTPSGIRAVMAAEQLGGGGEEPWRFTMSQPIPSYLIAIAAGDIDFRPLGPRSGVFAEPSVVEKAAWEFADTEAMIEANEKLFGPYRWDRYDLIVLPPSFPFGGMENPRLTFATPTVLAGDRSLVALIAHELAHSWSGNLVTNATWADFWLNEGLTVYLENRILESLYGRERSEMEAVLGRHDLEEALEEMEPGDQVLHNTSLGGRDPGDAETMASYEKGYLFLRLLDEEFGRATFDPFLRKWFDDNAFQSRTTADFEAAMDRDLFKGDAARKERLEVKKWLYAPGLPQNAPQAVSDAFDRAAAEAAAFAGGTRAASAIPAGEWTIFEWRHFLRTLPDDLPAEKMAELDSAWSLSATGNSEILMEWLLQSIRSGYEKSYPALVDFLMRQGRRKFLEPLYKEMAKSEEGMTRALEIYAEARPTYHSMATNAVDEILGYGRRAAATP